MYASTKSSDTKRSEDENYGPNFLLDGLVDNSGPDLENNWLTRRDAIQPWLEITLTEAVDIAAVEFTTSSILNFMKIDIRAGMNGTSLPHHGSSADLLTDNPVHGNYMGPNTDGEVVYITFSKPIKAKYLVIQARNLNSNLMLSELRIIKCKQHNIISILVHRFYDIFSSSI